MRRACRIGWIFGGITPGMTGRCGCGWRRSIFRRDVACYVFLARGSKRRCKQRLYGVSNEENWDLVWDGEYVSTGFGGEDQLHEGRGRLGGVCEDWRGADG